MRLGCLSDFSLGVYDLAMNWKPGDAAIIDLNCPGSVQPGCPDMHGKTCMLMEWLGDFICGSWYLTRNAWRVRCDGTTWIVAEAALRKLPGEDDQPSWDAIEKLTGWNPSEIVFLK